MRLNGNIIGELNAYEKGDMSVFKDRGVQIYRSNSELTARYFGNRTNDPCYFELVTFNYAYGKPEVFLQFPYTNFYVELTKKGSGARGFMSKATLGNPIGDITNGFYYDGKLVPEEFNLYQHDTDALVDFGLSDFVFLTKIAELVNPLHGRSLDNVTGEHYISNMLSKQYVKIPNLRRIAYALTSANGDSIIVDQSAYNFTYEDMRCWFRKGYQGEYVQVEIKNFRRYRDGGTTIFEFDYEGEHEFFYPSTLGSYKGEPKLDETTLQMISLYDQDIIAEKLGIMLEPLYEKTFKNS